MSTPRLILIAALLLAAAVQGYSQSALIVVRHAERADQSQDTRLSAKGEERARLLAHTLADANVSAIYVTQFQRTAQTAQPLAEKLNVKPVVVEAQDVAGLALKIRTNNADQVVLVVGHSDTVPNILKAFGHLEPVTIEHDEFDSLFILVPRSGKNPSLLRLKYGAAGQ
jgi:broad specificity phosphatase PhoE